MTFKKTELIFACVFAAIVALLPGGCATGKSAEQSEPAKAQAPAVAPLQTGYSEIYVSEIETTPALKQDYEGAIAECRSSLISSLLSKSKYKKVEPAKGETVKGRTSLLVKLRINDMRIASSTARMWGGVFAGNSFMNIHMTLVDAGTKSVVREEDFNSTNSAWAAAWNLGASDRSMPVDMGKIMADYIEKAVPAK
ncbi:MAG: DUF4410 domain-containing protein [Desulfobacteraceae bacterium]|nr:MAG: DUF4410 domain-containing protein [Desulfobacteraceae bacterium]